MLSVRAIILGGLLLVFLQGCTAIEGLARGVGCLFQDCSAQRLMAYVGLSRDEVIKRRGPPTTETTLDSGETSMLYISQWATEKEAGTCRVWFLLDHNKVVTDYGYRNC